MSFSPIDNLILLGNCRFLLLISAKSLYTWCNLFFIMPQWWSGSAYWNRDTHAPVFRWSDGTVPWNSDKLCVELSPGEIEEKKKKAEQLKCRQLVSPSPRFLYHSICYMATSGPLSDLENVAPPPDKQFELTMQLLVTVSVWKLGELRHKMNKSCLLLAGHLTFYFNHRQVGTWTCCSALHTSGAHLNNVPC